MGIIWAKENRQPPGFYSIFFFHLGYFSDPVLGVIINFGKNSSEAKAKVGEGLVVIRYH